MVHPWPADQRLKIPIIGSPFAGRTPTYLNIKCDCNPKGLGPAHHQQIGKVTFSFVALRSPVVVPLIQKVQKVRKSVIWYRGGSIYQLFEALEGIVG